MAHLAHERVTVAGDSSASADGGSLPSTTMVVAGYDGSNVQVVKTDSDGVVQVDVLSLESGTYAYQAGTGDATVDVPAGARLRRVMVVANASSDTTVTIGGGNTITVLAGGHFDEQIAGDAVGSDVVIGGGDSRSYYVAWTT